MQQHLYIKNSYTPEQIKIMENHDTRSGIKRNFISDDEFYLIKEMCNKIKDWPEIGKVSKYYGMTYNDGIGKIVKKVFQDKLHELIGEHELDFFVFQEAIEPWKVHADLRWYPDKIPHKTICVPLDVVDNNEYWSDTYTIIFKQRNYFRKAPNTNEGSYGNDHATWSRPIDDINTENVYSGYKITEQQHKEYFSHMPYDALEGLEIESINLWEPNSVIFWGQNQIHCSDNFIANNIQTKKSLIFFTNIKPN